MLLLLAGTTAGCGDSGGEAAAPEPAAGSGSPPASSSASPSSAPAPAEDPPSAPGTVEPATGPLLEAERVTVRAPQGWQPSQSTYLDAFPYLAGAQDGVQNTIVVTAPVAFSEPTLAEQAQEVLATEKFERAPEVREPVSIDGREWYHLAGQISATQWLDRYGTVHNDGLVSIEFRQAADLPEAERSRVVESVLATIEWPAAG